MVKTILITFSATLTAAVTAGSIFINSILGVFGLATTSLETAQNLHKSQAIVETMKKRNKAKKSKVTKRFMKRTGKRIAGSAVAASTIGTAAVVTTIAILEVEDYCDEQQELINEENLLFDTDAKFDYETCKDEAIEDVKSIAVDAKNSVSESVRDSLKNTSDYTKDKWDEVKAASGNLLDRIKGKTSDLWSSAIDWGWE